MENIIPHKAVEYRWNIELKSMNQILRHFVNIQISRHFVNLLIHRHFVNIPRICLTLRLGLYTHIVPADVKLSNYKQHFSIFLNLSLSNILVYFFPISWFNSWNQYIQKACFFLEVCFLKNILTISKGDLSFYTFCVFVKVVDLISLKLD